MILLLPALCYSMSPHNAHKAKSLSHQVIIVCYYVLNFYKAKTTEIQMKQFLCLCTSYSRGWRHFVFRLSVRPSRSRQCDI